MKLVIFGLTISSSWSNGHATLWRGLCRALHRLGHRVVFFERDVPYYAQHRDLMSQPGCEVVLYPAWREIEPLARKHLRDAEVAMVTSYCPDGIAATESVVSSRANVKAFYDLDTAVTLDTMCGSEPVSYLGPRGLRDFDLVLSSTGGRALTELRRRLGARRVAALYGHVDPDVHRPVRVTERYRADVSYLGTYEEDRQAALNALFIESARRLPNYRFVIGGAMYPKEFPWAPNISFVEHLPPSEHPAFFSSSRISLNVTRRAVAEFGYCPSARLFEAAACGTPILTDWWEGMDMFFEPGREIMIAHNTEDAVNALQLSGEHLVAITRAARDRVLVEHSSDRRARQLEDILNRAAAGQVVVRDSEVIDVENLVQV